MKKFVKVLATSAMALSFVAVSAMADKPAPVVEESNGMPSGAHFQFNMIGHPGGIEGDDSNGRAIMIPLTPFGGSNPVTCAADGTYFTNSSAEGVLVDGNGDIINETPGKGVKIYFTAGSAYEITDRDATDGIARVVLDTTTNGPDTDGTLVTNDFDVYIRVLGKPSQCMHIDGYVEVDTGGWLKTGSVELKKAKGGKEASSAAVKITDIFKVDWCTDSLLVNDNKECSTYTEYSVFDTLFGDYFWDVQNNGTKIVQVRFYPTAAH